MYFPKSGLNIVEQQDLTVREFGDYLFEEFLEKQHTQREANTEKRTIPTTKNVFHEALRSDTTVVRARKHGQVVFLQRKR